MKMIRTHGWVIEMGRHHDLGGPGDFYDGDAHNYNYCGRLVAADVMRTRMIARGFLGPDEVVRKVSLDEQGMPIEVIPGR